MEGIVQLRTTIALPAGKTASSTNWMGFGGGGAPDPIWMSLNKGQWLQKDIFQDLSVGHNYLATQQTAKVLPDVTAFRSAEVKTGTHFVMTVFWP
jgi:hypothetical protein